ncbi:reverse transcriptase domain-containing protein [Tanacetum coccineum]
MPPPFINPEEDERVKETLTDPKLAEYTIKVPPPLVLKAKHPSLKNYVVHKRDPLYPNIPYPSRMNQEKQQEKDDVQIHIFWKMFKQLHINISLADALILISKYQKMLKKVTRETRRPWEISLPCGFSELKCKALSDLGASINLIPLSVWKKLGLIKLISTRITLELANRTICTPARIARDVFVPVGKFTFPADFFIVDYKSDTQGDIIENLLNLDKTKNLPPYHDNHLSGSTTSSSPSLPISETSDYFLEEFADELAHLSFPPGIDYLPFDAESDLREIEYLLNHDPIEEVDSILERFR